MVPAELYLAALASRTAALQISRRVRGVIPGEGASSMSFWCRRWMVQSRSYRWTMLPASSPRICTSTWRGISISFSR